MSDRIIKTNYKVEDMDNESMVISSGADDDFVGTSAKIYYTWTDGFTNVYETSLGWFIINRNTIYVCDCYSPDEAIECAQEYTQHLRYLKSIEKDIYHLC